MSSPQIILPGGSQLHESFRNKARFLMASVMALAVPGLLGWQFDITWIKHPLPNLIAMNPIVSVCFIGAGTSFFLFQSRWQGTLCFAGAWMFAAIPFVIGVLRITEIVGGVNFGIDHLRDYDQFRTEVASNLSTHIALNTAFNFVLIGPAIILSNTGNDRNKIFSDLFSIGIIALALFALLGHLYRVPEQFGVLSYLPVAIHTAAGMLLVGFALIFANAGRGFLKVIFTSNAGGTTARILIPAGILIPFLMGYLRLVIQWRFPISLELGTSYLITGIVLLLFVLILFTAGIIERNDVRRAAAEQSLMNINLELEKAIAERTADLSRNEKFFRSLIENSTDAVLLTDKDLQVTFQSPGAERMTGISLERRRAYPNVRYTHPDELPIIAEAQKKALARPGVPVPFQSRFLHLDGNYIWIEGVMTNLLDDKDINAIAFNYRDVTERKRIEERRDLYVSMVNLSDDAILSLTLDGNVSTWNRGAEKLFGYTDAEMIGVNSTILIPDHLQVEERSIIARVAGGEFIEHFETQRRKKDGSLFYISLTVSPIQDLTGKVIGASEIAHDITGRKAAAEKMASSEKRFRTLIENITDAIVLNDADSNIIYQSPSVMRILGYTPEERVGKPVSDYVHPDYQAFFTQLYKDLNAHPGKEFPFEYLFRHKNGNYIWLEGFVTNLLNDPDIQAYVTNYRDVTESKQANAELVARENRFRALIESSADGVVLIDAKSNIIYRSPAAARIGGFGVEQKSKESIKQTHPEDLETIRQKFKEAFQNPGVAIPFQGRFMNGSGSYFWLEGTLTNLLGVQGVNAIVTNFQDITIRKTAEEQIIKLNLELEEKVIQRTSQLQIVNKELEAFTYSVSHDLRAPLRIINGFSEILIEDHLEALDEKGQKTLNGIVRNAKKMGQLIDDLLEFSRIGRTELRFSQVDMNDLVKETLQDLQTSGIAVPANVKILDMQPANGDGNLIKLVWSNLLSNAIKYSSKKERPSIEIGMTSENKGGYYYVKDNGAGFDMQYYEKLFGVFQRLHKQEEFSGTGVGLALAQRIVARHGGKIKAEGVVEKGATFLFSLPKKLNVKEDITNEINKDTIREIS